MSKSWVPPPSLDKETSYKDWKKEVQIWQALTELKAEKQGPAIFMGLRGKAKESVLELDIEQISAATGVKAITNRLDKIYLKDENQTAYLAYETFEKFKRPPEMSMNDYLIEFERLYHKIQGHNMVLPDGVLAYRVLQSANLTPEQQQLARATLNELRYDAMIRQLKKIFGDTVASLGTNTEVKIEPVLQASADTIEQNYFTQRGGYQRSRFRRGRPATASNQRYAGRKTRPNNRRMNPSDQFGSPSRCNICQSIYHWALNCPHSYENQEPEDVRKEDSHSKVTFFAKIREDEMQSLVGETLSCAVLDCGCTKTVCGNTWYQCFIDNLENDRLPEEHPSQIRFKFGDSEAVCSMKRVFLPVIIGSKEVYLETEIVPNEIPLLLSQASMKKAEAVLDFINDSVTMFGEHHHQG
ncbi:uncharacterized protein LOC130625028 [Hydractinia symbiolongicarpus]|uniref:uncharacterized protein LOC130625028 n=1 Tax=Hydractinia symbiolongicarpus TaxID=13093 RepID=UPI00254E203A|nr:uncharacterized protein LOC130625028 [Hydractinia symbiolongicarpus]